MSSYFNPCSNEFNAWNDFSLLSCEQRTVVCFVTGLVALLSFGLLATPVFRILVGRFKRMESHNLSPTSQKANVMAQITLANIAPAEQRPSSGKNVLPISASASVKAFSEKELTFFVQQNQHVVSSKITTQADSKLNITNINVVSKDQVTFAEVRDWMITTVGPYKPMGYLELDLGGLEQEQYFKEKPLEIRMREYGELRTKECEKRKEEILTNVMENARKVAFDNIISLRRPSGPQSHNEEALFELLKLNFKTIESTSHELSTKNKIFTKEQLEQMRSAILSNNIRECTNIFVTRVREGNLPFVALVRAAFGNSISPDLCRINGENTFISDGKREIILPKKGVAEIIRLKNQFSNHSWHTIRNLLVYFHRYTKLDGFAETAKILSQIKPREGFVFFIHDHQCYAIDESCFVE